MLQTRILHKTIHFRITSPKPPLPRSPRPALNPVFTDAAAAFTLDLGFGQRTKINFYYSDQGRSDEHNSHDTYPNLII